MSGSLWACACAACAQARDDIEEDFRIYGLMVARRDDDGHVIRVDLKDVYLPARWESTVLQKRSDHFYEPVDEAARAKTLRVIANMVPQKGVDHE